MYVPTQELLLHTLHWCFQVDTSQGLKCGAISSSVPLLSHPSPSVRGNAARLLYDLTTPYAGKEEACGNAECVNALVKLLPDEDSFVRSQATAALMRYTCIVLYTPYHLPYFSVCVSIAVITRGKYSVLEARAMTPLIGLLNDPISEVRTNAVKVNHHLIYSQMPISMCTYCTYRH